MKPREEPLRTFKGVRRYARHMAFHVRRRGKRYEVRSVYDNSVPPLTFQRLSEVRLWISNWTQRELEARRRGSKLR
jgi:hypothetical protein